MRTKAKQAVAAGMSLLLLLLCASCTFQNKEVAMKLFKNRDKISYSSKYYELKEASENKSATWRQGMISGNGETGFITSGAPYSDSMIFQNVHFVMPNNSGRGTADVGGQLNDVKQAIINGKNVNDNAGSQQAYSFHPGGALRLIFDEYKAKKYIRYTDYESGEVGVNFSDEMGSWERKSFTSMADNAVITRISCLSGSKTRLLLSYDDISTFANFGTGNEVDTQVKTLVDDDASYIAFLGHYPDYENSALADGGWLTFTYVLPEGGTAERVTLEREWRAAQDVSGPTYGISISDAYAVNLITLTVRIDDLCDFSEFASTENYPAVRDAERNAARIEKQYITDGDFDYEKALKAHTDIYTDQFNAVTLTLEEAEGLNSNEALLSSQKNKKTLNASFILRAYNAGRYAMLCCGGSSAGRATGLWTGEFNPGWAGKYQADDLSLQAAALGTANIPSAPVGYASLILRQAADWEENAAATHGFDDAIQVPAVSDGDTGALIESGGETPYRYWNAGAALLLRPLYEAVLAFGDMEIPLTEDVDLDALCSVLSVTEEDLSDEMIAAIEAKGSLSLQSHVLLPLLVKAANYWLQMADPAYYTDVSGGIHYSAGKKSLQGDETYCLLPGYTPGGVPDNYTCSLTANTAIDVAACRETVAMLLDVIDLVRISNAQWEKDADEILMVKAEEIDTAPYEKLVKKLPAYRYDETGALTPWATTAYASAETDASLDFLSAAWPFTGSKSDSELWSGGRQAIRTEELLETDSAALARRALVAARLRDRTSLTQALLTAETDKLRYSTFMTNETVDGKGVYSASYAIGFTAAVNEGLVSSAPGTVELLPCVPESGFDVGSISGLRTQSNATITLMSWDLGSNFVIAEVTSDIDQTITFSSPFSSEKKEVKLTAGKSETVSLDLDLSPDAVSFSDSAATTKKRDVSAAEKSEKTTRDKTEETTIPEDVIRETTSKSAEDTTSTTAAVTTTERPDSGDDGGGGDSDYDEGDEGDYDEGDYDEGDYDEGDYDEGEAEDDE